MADKYDKNGYSSSDFKRNSNQDNMKREDHHEQDGEGIRNEKAGGIRNEKAGGIRNEKAGEYMRELLSEKIKLNNAKFPVSSKLIDQEVTKVQASGRVPPKNFKYLDVYNEKIVKVVVKVLVPVKEHPKINFIGKLMGPMGSTMKLLQDETMCKMAVLGKGSIRDKKKEEDLRNSLDPKYAHLSDELHVEISALAPPAEAHARIAYALAEVKKYLTPDADDIMRMTQMQEIMERGGGPPPHMSRQPPRMPRQSPRMPPAPPRIGPPPRQMPPKTKVFSILDRARSAMETSYGYDDHYSPPEQSSRGPTRAAPEQEYYYERRQDRFYDEEPYYKDDNDYKGSAREVGTRRPGPQRPYRASPYARQPKSQEKKHSH